MGGAGRRDMASRMRKPSTPPGPCGSIPQQSITVGQTATVNVCFEDPNGDMLNYTVATSSPRVATASTSGGTVTVTAVSPGIAIVTVTASDPGGLNAQLKFQVMVPNRAPVVIGALADQTVNLGDTATLDLSAVFSDPDGDTMAYAARSSDGLLVPVSVSGSTITITGRRQSEVTVTATATDPEGATATQTFQVTVPNRAPVVVKAIANQIIKAGETVVLDLTSHFRDPDSDPLVYSVTTSRARVATASLSEGLVTVGAVAEGTAFMTATARDPGGLRAQQFFNVTAVERWMAILRDMELPDVIVNRTLGCTRDELFDREVGTVDDVMIVAAVGEIDGPGGTLGSAGPCFVRRGSSLPVFGGMIFDVDDLDRVEERGGLEEVILHEMGHVLGFGSLWGRLDLIRDPTGFFGLPVDTHFAGSRAIEAFQSMADMGYTVDPRVAEPYRLPIGAAAVVDPVETIEYGDDVWTGPIFVVDGNGRVVRVIRR